MLPLQTFSQLVSTAAAAVQGAAAQLIDLTAGSVLRAILEANAAIALWLQALIVQVLQMTRAATSNGSDLDSWMADFGVARLPAVAAEGRLTFARFSALQSAVVPVGSIAKSADGTQSFAVIADTTEATWSSAAGGYLVPAGTISIDVPVVALVPGSGGNMLAGIVTTLASALPGIDTVTNQVTFAGGLDAESDFALRARFTSFLSSRPQATNIAVGYAVTSLRQGLDFTVVENALPDGSARPGTFLVVVDDGTGSPPPPLLQTVATAVEVVRPVGSSFSVQPPSLVMTNVTMAVATSPSAVHTTVAATVQIAIEAYINGLPIGSPLPWSRLSQIAYQASPDVLNVTNVLLNGGTVDLMPGPTGIIRPTSVVVA